MARQSDAKGNETRAGVEKSPYGNDANSQDASQLIIKSLGRNLIYVFIFAAFTALAITLLVALLD